RSAGKRKATATAEARSPFCAIITLRRKNVKRQHGEKKLESKNSKHRIMKSENALKKYNDQLEIEANRNNLAQLNELSKKISQVKQEIEYCYREYGNKNTGGVFPFGHWLLERTTSSTFSNGGRQADNVIRFVKI